jgi:ABC-2 type transport system ATP-binding protein
VLAEHGRAATVILATHQTEDVAALCERVVVLDAGAVRFHGSVSDLVGAARGKVWQSDQPGPGAQLSWRTAAGVYRNLGVAPPGAQQVEPTLEDAYLLLRGSDAADSQQDREERTLA